MRILVSALCLVPALLTAQPPAAPVDVPARPLGRRAEGAGAVTVRVMMRGRLARGLAATGASGTVALKDGTGTVTAPATLELGLEPGAVAFRVGPTDPAIEILVPGTALRARGMLVQVVRDSAGGLLRVETGAAVAK
jgi:hypothetical protein